eukprot:TRINITY_DN15646_c0_g1_i1.p1 TRINITY_DN15646_c0_g1~~TRINITY_DN15646_c0_g1_i1.p1  ORF type:complete len:311 (+),score=54.23 TRINITY_DN15646_c0_g1_i1:152-1084(+)
MSSRDPFDDPFFQNGFGASSSLFDRDPFMSSFFGGHGQGEGRGRSNDPFSHIHSMMDSMHRDMMNMMAGHRSTFASLASPDTMFAPHHHLLDHHHRGESQGSQVEVEDVSDNPHHHHHERSTSQPVVEEPDDDDDEEAAYSRPAGRPLHAQAPVAHQRRQQQRPQVFSYSSSTTTRIGPNGVAESRHIAQDSTGNKRMAVRRGVGQQAREWVQERAADGRERSREQLYGMSEDQVDQFDQRWEQERVRLPGERSGRQHRALAHDTQRDDYSNHGQGQDELRYHPSPRYYPASDQASVSSRASSHSQQHRY